MSYVPFRMTLLAAVCVRKIYFLALDVGDQRVMTQGNINRHLKQLNWLSRRGPRPLTPRTTPLAGLIVSEPPSLGSVVAFSLHLHPFRFLDLCPLLLDLAIDPHELIVLVDPCLFVI